MGECVSRGVFLNNIGGCDVVPASTDRVRATQVHEPIGASGQFEQDDKHLFDDVPGNTVDRRSTPISEGAATLGSGLPTSPMLVPLIPRIRRSTLAAASAAALCVAFVPAHAHAYRTGADLPGFEGSERVAWAEGRIPTLLEGGLCEVDHAWAVPLRVQHRHELERAEIQRRSVHAGRLTVVQPNHRAIAPKSHRRRVLRPVNTDPSILWHPPIAKRPNVVDGLLCSPIPTTDQYSPEFRYAPGADRTGHLSCFEHR